MGKESSLRSALTAQSGSATTGLAKLMTDIKTAFDSLDKHQRKVESIQTSYTSTATLLKTEIQSATTAATNAQAKINEPEFFKNSVEAEEKARVEAEGKRVEAAEKRVTADDARTTAETIRDSKVNSLQARADGWERERKTEDEDRKTSTNDAIKGCTEVAAAAEATAERRQNGMPTTHT